MTLPKTGAAGNRLVSAENMKRIDRIIAALNMGLVKHIVYREGTPPNDRWVKEVYRIGEKDVTSDLAIATTFGFIEWSDIDDKLTTPVVLFVPDGHFNKGR